MEFLKKISPLFTAGIFFVSFLALLLAGFGSMLNAKIDPIKENQARFDNEVRELKAGQAKLEAGQAKVEAGQAKLEAKVEAGLGELKADIAEIKSLLAKP